MTRDELDALSSRELHDLAVRRALHHVDVEFFWQLLRAIPAAEASEGHVNEAGRDVTHLSVLLDDAIDSGEGDVAEALRPLYLDYLDKTRRQRLSGADSPDRSAPGKRTRAGAGQRSPARAGRLPTRACRGRLRSRG